MSSARTDSTRDWVVYAAIAVIVLFLYVFMEWLFFVTKLSFMTSLGFLGKLRVLLVTALPLLAAGAAGSLLLWVPAFATRSRVAGRISSVAVSLFTAMVLAALFFLLVDNFTVTVLRFGIKSTVGIGRYVYALLFVILLAFSYQIVGEFRSSCARPAAFRAVAAAAVLLIIASASVAVGSHVSARLDARPLDIDVVPLESRPNIILISGDGLDAGNMSVYGYRRNTTPFLDEMADRMLLCENCFANSDASLGSIASILTGKLPTKTRVIYPPGILQGRDAYEHLPGILRKYGYRNIDISVRHYADPIEMNMKDSFEWVNFRTVEADKASRSLESLLGQKPIFFMQTMRYRLMERLYHSFGVRRMPDPLAEVAPPEPIPKIVDAGRVDALFSFVDRRPSDPFFAHLHLLGTHGPKFAPEKRVYSVNLPEKITKWSVDAYDDAVLEFDGRLNHMVQELRARGILRSTIVVVCTDHAQRWVIGVRIPLLFLFPDGKHAGRISANVQNLDIVPTLLDYIGLEKPAWMSGRSLIEPQTDPGRPLFTVGRKRSAAKRVMRGFALDRQKVGPPFYSMESIGMIVCQKLYLLDLESGALDVTDIDGHTSPCGESDLPPPQDARRSIVEHLAENGYKTSSIRTPPTPSN